MANRWKTMETGKNKTDFIFLVSKITADSGCNHEIKRSLLLERKAMTNLVQFTCLVMSNSVTPWTGARQASLSITGSKRLLKLMSIESVMPSNHLILCHPLLLLPSIFASIRVRLEKTLESPLNCKEIKPVNPKGNQYWIFIGRTEAEATTLWPPDVKNWFTRKDPDAEEEKPREPVKRQRCHFAVKGP